ncbi:hypothetical protein J6590_033699 [Homalodisca vitripennis]|nr:hypothetical protein J6590_033699 [Homalodisca vitripennis]
MNDEPTHHITSQLSSSHPHDFRTTTNGRVGGLLARTGSLGGHSFKQQPRSTSELNGVQTSKSSGVSLRGNYSGPGSEMDLCQPAAQRYSTVTQWVQDGDRTNSREPFQRGIVIE